MMLHSLTDTFLPEDLLRSTAVLLDSLLDSSEQLLKQWASKELVEAICEAAEQSRWEKPPSPQCALTNK